MRKQIKLVLLSCLIALPMFAQNSASTTRIIEQTWHENTFASDKSLLANIGDMSELKNIVALLIKADIEGLSNSDTRLSVFIPLDTSLDRLNRKHRKLLLEKTSDEDLKEAMKNFIVPARLDYHSIKRNIENNNNTPIQIQTLGNQHLEFSLENNQLILRNQNGSQAKWVEGDFYYKNGFFHFIDLEISEEKIK